MEQAGIGEKCDWTLSKEELSMRQREQGSQGLVHAGPTDNSKCVDFYSDTIEKPLEDFNQKRSCLIPPKF